MRFTGRALLASTIVLGACAGGEKKTGGDTTAAATTTTTTKTDTTATSGAAGGAATSGGGNTVTVQMVNNAAGTQPRFVPATVTIKPGDTIKWVFGQGVGPHNVAFDSAKVSPAAKAALGKDMTNTMQPLMSNFLNSQGETYSITFTGVPPGDYYYYCLPHDLAGMNGHVIVK